MFSSSMIDRSDPNLFLVSRYMILVEYHYNCWCYYLGNLQECYHHWEMKGLVHHTHSPTAQSFRMSVLCFVRTVNTYYVLL